MSVGSECVCACVCVCVHVCHCAYMYVHDVILTYNKYNYAYTCF